MSRSRLSRIAGLTVLAGLLSACSVLAPLPAETSGEDRLKAIPTAGLSLEGRVTIHWDEHQIPFIEAERDADLPVAIGLVHAHLRLGQMELLRRISPGVSPKWADRWLRILTKDCAFSISARPRRR